MTGSGPPEFLRRAVDPDGKAVWCPLNGGRSNRLWRVDLASGPVVAKLFRPSRSTPLFPNDAGAEALALRALAGTGLAPVLVDVVTDQDKATAVIYAHADGGCGPVGPGEAARTLAALHRVPAPDGLRRLGDPPAEIRRLGQDMPPRPMVEPAAVSGPYRPVFLHGDPVPANMVKGAQGVCLIDWQCPAIGDATEDIAIFLSPAMQYLYGGTVLSPDDTGAFLTAYGDAETAQRYRHLAPLYHWRMAAYCLWMAGKGAPDYAAAARLELAVL